MNSHDQDGVATYAIHALPTEEARFFELCLDTEAIEALHSFRRVALALITGLPEIAPAPPPGLWERIRVQLGGKASI
jgi:hypothetical protein